MNSKTPIEEKAKYFARVEREHLAVVWSYQHWEEGVAFHNEKMASLRATLDRSSGARLLLQLCEPMGEVSVFHWIGQRIQKNSARSA